MQTSTEIRFFQCAACQKRHPWSEKIAGKSGRCKCGNRMTVPAAPVEQGRPAQIPHADDPHPSDLYDLAGASATLSDVAPVRQSSASQLICPGCSSAISVGAVLCTSCGFHLKLGRRVQAVTMAKADVEPAASGRAVDVTKLPPMRKGLKVEAEAPRPPQSVLIYLILPIVLIVIGLVVTPFGAALSPDGWKNVADVAGKAYVGLGAELGFVLVAMLAVSAVGGISFDEPLWRVALKLCAVATLPGPVGQLVQNSVGDVGGSILGNFAQLSLYFGIFILLFRQALQDTVICVFAIFIIRVFVAYMMYRIQGAMTGSSI